MEMEPVVLSRSLKLLSSLRFPTFSLLSNPNPLQVLLSPPSFHFLVLFFGSSSKLKPVSLIMDAKGKKKMVKVVKKEAAFVESDGEDYDHCVQEDDIGSKKMKGVESQKGSSGASGGGSRNCQVENCMADLSDAKQYHRRHKVCEVHAKAKVVLVAGIRQRFCQQCSRFHELSEFDETKRSCRRRLAGHNERRRKNAAESNGEGSNRKGMSTQLKDMVCGQVDDKGRIKIAIQENATYKHFQIR